MDVIDSTTGRRRALKTDADGNLLTAGAGASPLPSGAATAAKQDTLIAAVDGVEASLSSLDTKATTGNTSLGNLDTNTGAIADAAVTAGATGSISAKLRSISRDIGAFLAQLPASLGKKSVATSLAANAKSGGDEYETVAASQTDQVIGATGATGDYLEGLLCVVATAATSQVQIKDGSGSAITVLPNAVGAGVGSYYVPLGLTSTGGAWKVTTAAGVSVIAMGDFT